MGTGTRPPQGVVRSLGICVGAVRGQEEDDVLSVLACPNSLSELGAPRPTTSQDQYPLLLSHLSFGEILGPAPMKRGT